MTLAKSICRSDYFLLSLIIVCKLQKVMGRVEVAQLGEGVTSDNQHHQICIKHLYIEVETVKIKEKEVGNGQFLKHMIKVIV